MTSTRRHTAAERLDAIAAADEPGPEVDLVDGQALDDVARPTPRGRRGLTVADVIRTAQQAQKRHR